ncbi:MAG: HAMP domain-containing protein [Zoogloea sp.]|nr:HAMP domain-containing protein [Zoogloea sp.]
MAERLSGDTPASKHSRHGDLGRLFWKFFLIFWVVQASSVFGVGIAIWLHGDRHHHPPPDARGFDLDRRPPFGHRETPPDDRPPPAHEGPPIPTLPLAVGMVASVIFGALLALYVSKPIRNLRAAFEAAAQGRLDVRVGSSMGGRRDELADLGRDFDRMARRLQSLMDGQRRLLHDVSHELRSPLARLQAAVGLLRQQPERLEQSLERIEREATRMDRLVGELLTLSRLEAGVTGALDEDIELAGMLADIKEDALFETGDRPDRLHVAADGGFTVHGNQELLHRAVENVVRNALRHTPSESPVEIGVEAIRDGRQVHLSIRDRGPGVPEAELQSIFQPFFRSTNPSDGGGYGLGLAIARQVIAAHGGSIAARNTGDGLCVDIELPLKNG